MKTRKLVSMVQYILDIDWMSTAEFCDEYNVPKPVLINDVNTMVNQLLQVDAIKHKMFVEYAKFLNKELSLDMFKDDNKVFNEFEINYLGSGIPRIENGKYGKYKIINDEYGFYLYPYDSSDGRRITKVIDLVDLGIEYNSTII